MNVGDDSMFRHIQAMGTGRVPFVQTWGTKERAEIVPEPCIVVHWNLYYHYTSFNTSIRIFFWKNGKWLLIRCPVPTIRFPDGTLRPNWPQIDKTMQELRSFLDSLVFGKANLAYFIQGNDGRRAVVYRRRPLYCRIKLPLVVHRDELTFLRLAQGVDNVEVIWNGQQFDMQLVKDEISLGCLERQMEGYEMLRGLDLTYKVVGLVVGSDEDTIGLLTEPAFGRPFQSSDFFALSDAMCKLFDRGLWWPVDVNSGLMMSPDNKVRLITCYEVRKFKNDEERELLRLALQRELQKIHLQFPPNGPAVRDARLRPRHICQELTDRIAYFLERPIVMDIRGLLQKRFTIGASDRPLSVDRLSHRKGKNSSRLALAATTRIEEIEERHTDADQGESDGHNLVIHHHHPKKHCKSSHPYHRNSRKLVLAPE